MRVLAILFAGLVFVFHPGFVRAEVLDIPAQKPFYGEKKALEGLVITLDPGHGGSAHQPGYSGSARGVKSRVVEGDLNMRVAGQLRHYLMDAGAEVHITRWDDRKVVPGDSKRAEELGARTRAAVESRSHLFLSLHHNASEGASANGVVIMLWPKDSKGQPQPLERQFAEILREEVEKTVPHQKQFNLYSNDHPLTAGCDIPSATIEFGFLTNPEFDAWVSRPGSHVAEAQGAYQGVVRMWKEHRHELEVLRNSLFPEAAAKEGKPAQPQASTQSTSSTQSTASASPSTPAIPNSIRSIARQVWPLGRPPQTSEEIQRIFALYRRTVLSDSTLFYLNVKAEGAPERWILKGQANHPLLRKAAGQLLEAAGCAAIQNEIELLPSARLGEKRFGVVQIPMALTWDEPREQSDVQTQLLLGEKVFLLDVNPEGTYLLLHGGDGYVGWVRSETVMRMDAREFSEWENAPCATIVRPCMADDFRLPIGCSLPLLERAGAASATLRLPRGVPGTKDQPRVSVSSEALRFPPEVPPGRAAALAAKEFLDVPYVFGGRSELGVDCSGLTGVAYACAGITLARDARQQILAGRLVGVPWRWEALQPGDLLYFLDDESGRIYHTAISLGGGRFLHASPPGVHVLSLDPKDPLYDEFWTKSFALAKRPMP